MTTDAFVPRAQVAQLLGVHLETLKRYEREGRFPPPVRITRKNVGHLRSTVDRYLAGLSSSPVATNHQSGAAA